METENDYLTLLQAMIAVAEAVKRGRTEWGNRLADGEMLFVKCFFHAASALYLSRNTRIPETRPPADFLDIASIPVLGRAALESFLTFHYVFLVPTSDDEREFRYCAWKLAGLLDRQRFPATLPQRQALQIQERKQIDELKQKLASNPQFSALTPKQQDRLTQKGEWRLDTSWRQIALNAGLEELHAKHVYSYLCGHAHSAWSSVLQIGAAIKTEDRELHIGPVLQVIMIAMAFMVKGYIKLHPSIAGALDEEHAEIVDTWHGVGSGPSCSSFASGQEP